MITNNLDAYTCIGIWVQLQLSVWFLTGSFPISKLWRMVSQPGPHACSKCHWTLANWTSVATYTYTYSPIFWAIGQWWLFKFGTINTWLWIIVSLITKVSCRQIEIWGLTSTPKKNLCLDPIIKSNHHGIDTIDWNTIISILKKKKI